jgi:hypothetical protein
MCARQIGIQSYCPAKKRDDVLIWNAAHLLQSVKCGHEGPSAFRVFVYGRQAFLLSLFVVTHMNQFGALGEVLKGTVAIGGAYCWNQVRGGEALDEEAIASGEFDAGEEIRRRREVDATSFHEMSNVTGRLALREATEDFAAVEGSGLRGGTGRQKKQDHSEVASRSFHGAKILDTERDAAVPAEMSRQKRNVGGYVTSVLVPTE